MSTLTRNDDSCFKILHSCFCFKPILRQVHPASPSDSKHNEFLVIDNKRTLRIIHVKPDSQIDPNGLQKRVSMSRHSLTEEYWFTRWSKPLRAGSCNCSFRRSQRYSRLSNQINQSSSAHSNSRVIDAEDKGVWNCGNSITNVDTFVERLLQDTYFDALQEYLVRTERNWNRSSNGIDNLAYSLDNVVTLRNKTHSNNNEPSVSLGSSSTILSNIAVRVTLEPSKNMCSHENNSVKNKPLVILLHGIGSTADVWWNIIYNLHVKGYEVIAPDMLGHGYSSAPNIIGAYKFKNLLHHTLQVFDYYLTCEDQKAIIIGHSFGCSLGTALARHRMQKIVQLVLISGGGPTPLATPVKKQESSCSCATIFKPLLICGLKRSFFYSSRGKNFQPCEVNNGIPSYVLKYIEKGQNWPEGDAAFHRRILIPTLLVHGLQDTNVTLVQECEMERTIPRAFLELIPNAGHMSMLEAPERLSHMIICFIEWWIR